MATARVPSLGSREYSGQGGREGREGGRGESGAHMQPGVYLDGLDALHQCLVHLGPVPVIKPQSQNPGGGKTTVRTLEEEKPQSEPWRRKNHSATQNDELTSRNIHPVHTQSTSPRFTGTSGACSELSFHQRSPFPHPRTSPRSFPPW